MKRRWLARTFTATALAAAVCLGAAAASASDIVITSAESLVRNDIVIVNAAASFNFSKDAVAALNSGIPLVIELDLHIARPRKYLWDPEVFAARREYAIERHALSKQFVITDRVTDERRVHGSLELALDDLGRIHDLAVAEIASLGDAPLYEVALRLRLDIDALPAPMIPLAYVTPGWHMSSGWYRWQIKR